MCLPQVIKSFQNYRVVATTFYPTLILSSKKKWYIRCIATLGPFLREEENRPYTVGNKVRSLYESTCRYAYFNYGPLSSPL
jgi:hypothetical protein